MNPAVEEIFARIIAIGLVLAALYILIWPLVRAVRNKKPIRQMVLKRIIALAVILLLVGFVIPLGMPMSAPLWRVYIHENLRSIQQAQEQYHSEHGVYAGGQNTFELLDWEPSSWRSHLYFWVERRRKPNHAFFCGDDYIPNPTGDPIPRSARPAITGSSATGFTCTAVGKFEGYPRLNYWLVRDRGLIFSNRPSDQARYGVSEQDMQDIFSTDPSRVPEIFVGQDGRLQLRR